MAYMCIARASCLLLFTHAVRLAFSFAFARAGRSRPARMAMIAMTTSSSIRVNAPQQTTRDREIRHGTGLNVFTPLGIPPDSLSDRATLQLVFRRLSRVVRIQVWGRHGSAGHASQR